jgi:hypothetical protein
MKLLFAAFASALATTQATEAVFTAHRIAFDDLVKDTAFGGARASFVDALKRDGVISVTGVPNLHKQDTLATLHACALKSKTTQEHEYHDGTRRRTMATHTVPNGVQMMQHRAPDACESFEKASTAFRETVAQVTQIFSQRLASLLQHDEPLLSTEQGYEFETIEDVVEAGEHLEHFHSYQKHDASTTKEETTIDIHVDQGLFLVFSPALLVEDSKILGTLDEGFYVGLEDGSRARAQFNDQDDLVFLLGDGVNQYINPSITNDVTLRAAPHAVSMPVHKESQARVWYGRMVLPPFDALHPDHGQTFGSLRESNIQGEQKDLACSSNMVARQLEESSCQGDTLFCWEKCMSPSEYNVSEAICQEQGLNLNCTNEARELYVSGHGQFFPGCIDIETAKEVYGNPVHPSQQNQTDGTSGAFVAHGSFVAVALAAVIALFM